MRQYLTTNPTFNMKVWNDGIYYDLEDGKLHAWFYNGHMFCDVIKISPPLPIVGFHRSLPLIYCTDERLYVLEIDTKCEIVLHPYKGQYPPPSEFIVVRTK